MQIRVNHFCYNGIVLVMVECSNLVQQLDSRKARSINLQCFSY